MNKITKTCHSRESGNPAFFGCIFAITSLAVVLLVCGCENPFSGDTLETISIPPDRLRKIEMLPLESMSENEKIRDANESVPAEQPPAKLTLTIEECRAIALENNLDIKTQLFDPTIADESLKEAQARFEPLAFSRLGFVKSDTPGGTPITITLDSSQRESIMGDVGVELPLRTGGTITFDLPFSRLERYDTMYSSELSLSLSQPLLRNSGARTNTYAIRIAHYDAQIVQAQTRLEVTRVLAQVDRAYWLLYAFRRELEVRKQEYDLAIAQLQQAQRKVQTGQVAEIEIIRAEAAAAERLEAIILAENSVRDSERNLKRLLNRIGLEMETATVLIPATPPNCIYYQLDTERLLECAIEKRMELLELELQIARDASTIDFGKNQTLPLVLFEYEYNINALGGNANDSFDLLLDNRFVDHRIGLVLQVPIGNAAAKSRLQRAILQRCQRLATKQLRELQIRQEVLNAADQMEANWQRVVASRKSMILSERNLKAEQRQFELGLQTSTEVLDAQTSFANAQSAEIRAIVEYQIAQIDLAYATGTLLGAAQVHWEPQQP